MENTNSRDSLTPKAPTPSLALSIVGAVFCAASLVVLFVTGWIFTAGICPAVIGITLGAAERHYNGTEGVNRTGMSICIASAVIAGVILYGAELYHICLLDFNMKF